MALFDVDKTNNDRGTPSPNTHDVLTPGALMAKGTISSSYSTQPVSVVPQRMVMKNNMLIWYDDENRPSSVYGYVPGYASNVPVLAIAKYGYDVFVDVLGVPAP